MFCEEKFFQQKVLMTSDYSLNRREFLNAIIKKGVVLLGGFLSPKVFAIGETSSFRVAQLIYGKGRGGKLRPNAGLSLSNELRSRTSINSYIGKVEIPLKSNEIFKFPFLMMIGEDNFGKFEKEEEENLKTFINSGGFLFVDNVGKLSPSAGFDKALREEIKRVFVDNALQRVPQNHVLYRCFYRINSIYGRFSYSDYLEGLFLNERLAILYSQNDLSGAWSKDSLGGWQCDMLGGGDEKREDAIRLGINIVIYSLTLDYKDDRTHIEYLLKKKRLKIEDLKK